MKKDLLTIGCPEDKIIVHYHGIDTQRFDYPQRPYDREAPLTVLFCARLTPKKGSHILLKAIKHIREKGLSRRPFRTRLVGDGPMKETLVDFVTNNKMNDVVDFAGYIPHYDSRLLEEYHKADIFVLPSLVVRDTRTGNYDKEGIPGTLIEAIASGLPVVSTYHAGIPEVIDANRNGLLVNEGDDEELANKIADMLNDRVLRERLGQTARESVRKLDVRTKTRDLEDIYIRTMSEKQSKGTP
jgi:colanic acid/amylovoran biosynthesis glycosyltransferase